ncbi:MAG TPA: hypothetical protein VIP30_07290 [Stenotrophomonas sp.]|jgi:hypothetical protein
MKTPRLLLVAPLLAIASPAWAVEPLDTFSVRLTGYVTDFDTKLRADGQTDAGTRIDLQRDLGLDKNNTIASVGATWRPFDNHEFGLSYYQDSADADRRTRRDFDFNGRHYQTDTQLKADFDLDAYEAYYVYWALNRERWALGPRVGLLWYKMQLTLSANVDINGNAIGTRAENSVDADLPAPTIGGSWRWTPGEQWRIGADVGYFTADINDIDADVTFGRLGVEWYPWENWGVLVDYTLRRIDADADKSRFNGNLRFIDSGFRLGLTYRF